MAKTETKRCPTCGQLIRTKCAECGKPFEKWPASRRADSRAIYCSVTCRNRAGVKAFRKRK